MSESPPDTRTDAEEKQKKDFSEKNSSNNTVGANSRTEFRDNASKRQSPERDDGSGAKRKLDEDERTDNKKLRKDNTSVVAEHYNALEEKGASFRNQSRIVYMRNLNNWIKTMLIDEYIGSLKKDRPHGSSFTVLDMCCGKGGDLFKWEKLNITYLICADIAQISVEQCEERYNELKRRRSGRRFDTLFDIEFIAADCTKVRLREKYKDPSMQVDAVSCQFAFHYCFESLPQAECMLKNASESLKAGGYFIGTMPDAYEIVWQKSEGNKFGNDVYSIEFYMEDKTNIPLFGAKYKFHLEGVVDCPEFLVHLPTLKKLALKYGLKLVIFERFADFFERKKGEGKFLLEKMQALQPYSTSSESSLEHPSLNYEHAAQYMQGKPHHHKIGTISKAEWEAISLYAVFAFKKLKTTWNSDGKPEYIESSES